jgi:hypothetical protein
MELEDDEIPHSQYAASEETDGVKVIVPARMSAPE